MKRAWLFIVPIALFSACDAPRTAAPSGEEPAQNASALINEAAELVPEPDFPYTIAVKAAPPDIEVFLNETALTGRAMGLGVKNYAASGPGTLRFSAPGYETIELFTCRIPGILRHGLCALHRRPTP